MSDSSDFECGSLVFVADDFFELVNDPFLKTDKGTGHSRPHYFVIQDKFESDIFWVVPLSSKIQKFDRIVDRKIQANRPHDGLKKVKIRNREGYLLFQDMFPTKKRIFNGIQAIR
ncbi:type III toxin-antitoxin system CptIN family toxin [Weissella cibaria]|uniref:type III toxin-antitoxin system CptIN family toxin n=1 Tax=Weissella cibaria TaxID=137591 RepID=UPI00376EA4C7